MKFLSEWKVMPGVMHEAVDRFLAGQGQPPAGVKLLGRWHKIDGSGGYSLVETDDADALYELSAQWADVLEIRATAVIEDGTAGPVLAKFFKK